MSQLKDLGNKNDSAFVANTDFKLLKSEGHLATITTNTLLCLEHKQREEESLEEFKLRVIKSVYYRIQALYDAYPHDIEASGITMTLD